MSRELGTKMDAADTNATGRVQVVIRRWHDFPTEERELFHLLSELDDQTELEDHPEKGAEVGVRYEGPGAEAFRAGLGYLFPDIERVNRLTFHPFSDESPDIQERLEPENRVEPASDWGHCYRLGPDWLVTSLAAPDTFWRATYEEDYEATQNAAVEKFRAGGQLSVEELGLVFEFWLFSELSAEIEESHCAVDVILEPSARVSSAEAPPKAATNEPEKEKASFFSRLFGKK